MWYIAHSWLPAWTGRIKRLGGPEVARGPYFGDPWYKAMVRISEMSLKHSQYTRKSYINTNYIISIINGNIWLEEHSPLTGETVT